MRAFLCVFFLSLSKSVANNEVLHIFIRRSVSRLMPDTGAISNSALAPDGSNRFAWPHDFRDPVCRCVGDRARREDCTPAGQVASEGAADRLRESASANGIALLVARSD